MDDDDHIRSTPRFEPQPARPTADDMPGQVPDARSAAKDRIAFVDIGRALAALLVFYSHIHIVWMQRDNGVSSPVTDGLAWAFAEPLHLDQQDIGQVGVPIFFLISGFVITPIAMRQGTSRFAANRALRIYVPLVFAVLLTGTLLALGLDPLWTGQLREVTPLTLLTNSLLVNYLIDPQAVLLGVTWTLIVEMIFYLLLIVLLPVFRRSIWLGIAIELAIVHIVLMSRSELGPSWSLFAVNVSFIPILLCGQIVWAAFHRTIPRWLAGCYLVLSWVLYVWADRPDMARQDDSYDVALAFAFLLFLIGLLAEPRLRQRALWTRLSERSYSLYLLHGVIAFPVLDALHPALPIELAVVVAVLATFAGVEVSYRLVEGPSHRLARQLSHRSRPADPPPAVGGARQTDAVIERRSTQRPRHAAATRAGAVEQIRSSAPLRQASADSTPVPTGQTTPVPPMPQ